MPQRPIAVTGATGTTGRHLVPRLRARGVTARCLVRDVERARASLGADVELVAADLDDPESLAAGLAGAPVLYLNSGHGPSLERQQTNAVQAALASGVSRIVKLSGNVDCEAPITRAHLAVEAKIAASEQRYTFIRPSFFMTNLFYLAAALKTGDEFSTVVPGDVGQSMLDPRDIADLAAAVLADAVLTEDSGDASPHDGAAYYQTGGAAITFDETAAIMARVLGRTIRYRQMTPQAWADLVAGRGLPDWLVEHQVKMFGFAAAGAFSATTDVTERITGRAPRPLEAFIEENAGAFAKSA